MLAEHEPMEVEAGGVFEQGRRQSHGAAGLGTEHMPLKRGWLSCGIQPEPDLCGMHWPGSHALLHVRATQPCSCGRRVVSCSRGHTSTAPEAAPHCL